MTQGTRALAEAARHIFSVAEQTRTPIWAETLSKAKEGGTAEPPSTWLITALATAGDHASYDALTKILAAYDRSLNGRNVSRLAHQQEVRQAIDFHVYVLSNAGWSLVGLPSRGMRPDDELLSLLSEYRDIAYDKLSMGLHRAADHHFGGLASDQPPTWWEKHGWTTVIAILSAIIGAAVGAMFQR